MLASRNGSAEKPTIASRARRSIARIVYFVLPWKRASRSYSTVPCGNPTQRVMPLRKRCRSGITSSVSTTRRDISRKSAAPTGRSSDVSQLTVR
jgi:hypothetical protein